MNKLIEFPFEDGNKIMVEVAELGILGKTERVSRTSKKAIETANQSFESALDNVKPTANALIAKLRDLIEEPDEVSIEFGLKFTAESGIVLAAAGVEANFKVALKWQKNED